MEIIKELFINFINLANAMSLYIILGLIIAGFLKELLPSDFIIKHLGQNSISSIIKATLFGIPIPVCSCSVIPLAKSLQKEGASAGSVQSFLISTPITGADSILATYSFFGWFFTIYRVLTSIIIAIITGILQNIFYQQKSSSILSSSIHSKKTIFKYSDKNICCTNKCCSTKGHNRKNFSFKRVFLYAFNTLFKDISKSLFIGLIIGSLFTTFLPKELISTVNENNIVTTYILVLIISMPLYVCATSSLPIGISLLSGGLSIGATFVFLSAGPATNSITMSVVKEMFGKKGFFIYIGTIAVLSMFFGSILDNIFSEINITEITNQNKEFDIIDYLSTAIMLVLMFYYWRKR